MCVVWLSGVSYIKRDLSQIALELLAHTPSEVIDDASITAKSLTNHIVLLQKVQEIVQVLINILQIQVKKQYINY